MLKSHLAVSTGLAEATVPAALRLKVKSRLRRMRGASSVQKYSSTHTHCEAILTHTEIQPLSTCRGKGR